MTTKIPTEWSSSDREINLSRAKLLDQIRETHPQACIIAGIRSNSNTRVDYLWKTEPSATTAYLVHCEFHDESYYHHANYITRLNSTDYRQVWNFD